MIDPSNITNFQRSKAELEEFAIFAVLVAGKNAKTIAKRLDIIMKASNNSQCSPFDFIKVLNATSSVSDALKIVGIGCYNQKANTLIELVNRNINLENCSAEQLEEIKGIGRKTSRFFLLHSREGYIGAALDTHILKGMAALGYQVPKSTPSNKKVYAAIEQLFVMQAFIQGKTPAELDIEWWRHYSHSNPKD